MLRAGSRRGRLARHGGTVGHRRRPARRRSCAAARRRHPRHLRHCHRRHHPRPCRRRQSPQPRSSRLRATQRRTSSTSCVSPSLPNGGQAAARKRGAASTIVAERRFAQQTKIAKLLMSQILTDKSDCELKVQSKSYASFAARGVLALRRLRRAPSSAWDGRARNTSDAPGDVGRDAQRSSRMGASLVSLPVWLTRCALGRSYGFARGVDRKRAGIAPGRRRLVVAVRRAAAAATAAAAAAAPHRQPGAAPGWCRAFVVDDVECREADVSDFLLREVDFVTHADVSRQHVGRWPPDRRCGCRARERQRQPGGAQHR